MQLVHPSPSDETFGLLCRILSRPSPSPEDMDVLATPQSAAGLLRLAEGERVSFALHEALVTAKALPKELRAVLAIGYEANRRRNEAFRNILLELGAAGDAINIQFALLKGAAWLIESGTGYAAWRWMIDLDVLVHSDHFDAMPQLMERLGYSKASTSKRFEENFHHAPYVHPKIPVTLEVHRHIGWHHQMLPPEIVMASAKPIARGLLLPAPWIRAFHAMIHWQIQDYGKSRGTLPLKDVVDLARFLARADVEWQALTARAAAAGIIDECELAIASATTLLRAPVPSAITPGAAAQAWVARSVARRASPLRTYYATEIWRAGTLWRCEKIAYRAALRGTNKNVIRATVWAARIVRLPLLAVRALGIVIGGTVLWWRDRARSDSPAAAPPPRDIAAAAAPQLRKDVAYSFRPNRRNLEREYRLGAEALTWTDDRNQRRTVRYGDVHKVRLYKARRLLSFPPSFVRYWRCILYAPNEKITLSSLHYVDARTNEDRWRAFVIFARALVSQVSKANPSAIVEIEKPKLNAILGRVFVFLLRTARRFPLESSARTCSRMLRAIGPWLPQHRTALRNLRLAFPEKTASEIRSIADGMWNNFGRVFAEWPHLDLLNKSHITFTPESYERLVHILESGKPALFFGAHLANWELPAATLKALGLDIAVVFRRTRFAAVADELRRIRSAHVGGLILARFGAAFELSAAIESGTKVGMLIDHHSRRGVEVQFFGQRTKISPALARLARLHDCPIYGGRVIRLDDNRYHLELCGPLELPRDADGRVDIKATMQAVASIVEGWVREHPEQWRWLYRWWR
jgi:Kdo2-lipid IVA lauroyltransferase/acyltransferase